MSASHTFESSITVEQNTLYLVKIQAIQTQGLEEEITQLQMDFVSQHKSESLVLKTEEYLFPFSQELLTNDTKNKWYEQYIFCVTDDFINTINFKINNTKHCTLKVCYSPIIVPFTEINMYMKELKKLGEKTKNHNGKYYHRFLGIQEAGEFLYGLKLIDTNFSFPSIESIEEQVTDTADKTIAVIADEPFLGILESSYNCIKITPENLDLIRYGVVDLVIIQKRATQILKNEISLPEEENFFANLRSILSETTLPLLSIESNMEQHLQVVPIKNCGFTETFPITEAELCSFTPLKGKNYSLRNIFIPLVSDLYQYHVFNEMVSQLVKYNFKVSLAESTYGHVPIRTWERFSSNNIKVFDKLGANEIASICRSCGFMILFSESLRGKFDLQNLSAIAIMSGSIPIVIGDKLSAPFDKLTKQVGSFEELYHFIQSISTMIAHERYWLSLFRQFCSFKRDALFARVIESAMYQKSTVALPLNRYPSAEIICVTKRLKNLPIILESFNRQSYPNVSMHLIWNVSEHEYEKAKEIVKQNKNSKIKMSILDQSYNIGNCLNYGIRESKAKYWFKFDDDDYYGEYYVTDMVNWYEVSGADIVGKPTAFIYFAQSEETFMRNHSIGLVRKQLENKHFCGATLSGLKKRNHLLFSNYYRNACDSKWVESVTNSGKYVLSSDYFNFSIFRGNLKEHTWQLNDQSLKKNSEYVVNNKLERWLDV